MLSIKNIYDVYNYYTTQTKIKNNMIDEAIKVSYNMLSLDEFIKETKFKIPDIMDIANIKCYHADIPILMTRQLIESFGYSGEFKNQKVALMKLIKAHNLPYIKLNNEEYKNFTCLDGAQTEDTVSYNIQNIDIISLYPSLVKVNGKSTHIMIMPRDLKILMMVVNTPRGKIVRENFLLIEELLRAYLEYQCVFNNKSYENTVTKIYNMPQNTILRRMQNIQILEETLYNKNRIGVIYFITDGEFTKIGYTYNLPERLSTLQLANPRELFIKEYYFIQFPYEEEQRLHRKYIEYHIKGEWFDLKTV